MGGGGFYGWVHMEVSFGGVPFWGVLWGFSYRAAQSVSYGEGQEENSPGPRDRLCASTPSRDSAHSDPHVIKHFRLPRIT